jgi:uncharacterized protein (TIGR03086 family)
MDITTRIDAIDLLGHGYAWTAARIAAVSASDLDAPTPCGRWTLSELLDHTIDVLAMVTDAVAGTDGSADAPDAREAGSSSWGSAIGELAARSRRAWQAPGVIDRTFELSIGTTPAAATASITLLECVVHGWDISQASGEAAQIPDELAVPVLEFARQALTESNRGDNFAADLELGTTPSDQLVAFLGRKPL